jgi:hypothetical protein
VTRVRGIPFMDEDDAHGYFEQRERDDEAEAAEHNENLLRQQDEQERQQ